MINVLVFPCGSEIGLEIYNSVNKSSHFRLFGLSSINDHGKFVYENYIDGIGFYNDQNFIKDLKQIISIYNIEIIYPTMDQIIVYLKKHEKELGVKIVGPSYEVAKLCASKRETYNLLRNFIKVPTLYNEIVPQSFLPLYLKPNEGYGSRNNLKVTSLKQIENIDFDKMILCEYLPGAEYTIDCFTGQNKDLLFVGARERIRTNNGISVNTSTNKLLTEKFRPIAEKINEYVHFFGSWFFQLKLDKNNQPCLLEIACRLAGSSSVHRIQGVNFALANLYLANGIEPFFILNKFDVTSDRALNSVFRLNFDYETIFIDYDDTILINGNINLQAIQLIFQSINLNKKIILISKHDGNLHNSLKKNKLDNLFNHIIHLKQYESKVDYLKSYGMIEKSIFIDDSFSERQKVNSELGLPVFSVDAIPSLIFNQ